MKTDGALPVNIKMLVEGEEEVGSRNLMEFFDRHKEQINSDVIVVCDTENIEVGLPCITYSLRGIVAAPRRGAKREDPRSQRHGRRRTADAAIALNVILSRLYWGNGSLADRRLLRQSSQADRKGARGGSQAARRRGEPGKDCGLLPEAQFALGTGTTPYEQTWRRPAVTVIAQEASTIKGASNQVLPKASALVSCRIVPDQDARRSFHATPGASDQGSSLGCRSDGEAGRRACRLVDDRPQRPGLRGRAGALRKASTVTSRRSAAAAPSVLSGRSPNCSAGPGPAARHRGSREQRPCTEREPARRRLQEIDGFAGGVLRQPGKSPGRQGEMAVARHVCPALFPLCSRSRKVVVVLVPTVLRGNARPGRSASRSKETST